MKKSIYVTVSFKGLFSSVLAVLLIISVVFAVSYYNEEPDSVIVSSQAADEFVIIIDAGHGGEDGGTQSADGVLEKDINLQISLKLNSLLRVMGYNTVMTRQQDKLIYDESCTKMRQKKVSDINNRLEIAKSYPDSLFISIHQNYFTESKYSGAQVFYSPNNEESAVLAQSIQQSVCSLLQKENSRKIKKSGSEIFLLDNIKSPAVMVECGFMSNADEALKLTDEEYQKKMALAIASGINNYLSKP